MQPLFIKILLSLFVIIFGIVTIAAGGAAIFFNDSFFGHVIPWVVWFNFLSGFVYIAVGLYVWFDRRVAQKLSVFIFFGTSLVFVLIGIHIASGLAYEKRTIAAMAFRWVVWGIISWIGFYAFTKNTSDK